MAKFRGNSQIPSSGRIDPTIPISADLTEAYHKVDEFIGAVGKKQLIKVDADVSAAKGRLQRLLNVKGNNIQLDIGINQKLLKNSLADAKKLIRGAASALSVGDNSQYGQMRDTLASFIHGFENLSVVSGGKVVSGITDILKNIRNFDSITNMSFDVAGLQQAAKITEDIAESEEKIAKERQKRNKKNNAVQETEVLKTTLDRIKEIKNTVNRMTRELGKMDDSLGSADQLDAHLKRFDRYASKLSGFKEELTSLSGDTTDTGLSEGISKTVTVIDNALSSISTRAENTHSKLKTLVSDAFGELNKINNDPSLMEDEEEINNIYQKRLDIISKIGEKILKNSDPEKYKEIEKVNDSYKKRLDVLREQNTLASQAEEIEAKTSKTKLRTQAQINAELDKELQKLKEIEAQEKRNDAAREELKSAKTDYARVELGVDKAVYDTDKIDSATQSLRAFNTELDKATRSQFPERYKQLCDIITQSFTGQYSISNGLFKDLNDFIGQNADMRELSRLAEQGIKGVATKDINQLFRSVVNGLKSDTSTVKQLLHSGDVVGATVGKDLDSQEIELNQEMQRLYDERIAQEGKIAALKREELDLIIQQGQEEAKNAAVKIEETTDALGEQSKAFKSTTSSLDELKEKYFSIIKTVETYLELMLKFNKIEGNTWPKLRKNMINFIKDMPQDVIEMLTMDYGEKFTEGLRNSFKGMSSKDLCHMIRSNSFTNTMGALELKLNLAKNVDFDNIKYTDDGSIKLLDSDNPFEHLHPQHGIRLMEELYKTLDAIAKITSNHQEQLTNAVEQTADKSEIVAQNAEQLRDAYDKADEKVHSLRDSLAQATDEQKRLEQHAKVYGYTLDMSAQKAGRIQSVLSKTGTQFTIARAQAIPNLLKDGYEVDKYSDEYGISVPVSTSYTPITKTEYEYAQYLSSKIAELNVGWEEGLKILASQNGQLDAARQKVAQLEDELSIAEKQAEIAYERMAYASHGVFGNDNIEADKKRLAQSNAQTEANKKLTSSYEGLVEAVEKFHTVNQKAWSAYKNNSPDYQQLAQTKDNAIAGIQNLFPTGSVRDDIPDMLNSSGLKDANIEDILGFIESKLKYAVSEARTIANGEFVKQNSELIGQFANTDNFKDFEAKFTALSADILEGKLGLEGANKQLQEFADSLLNATKTQVEAEQKLSKMMLGNSGEALAGTKPINFKYAVMSVEDLVMSHDAYGTVNKNYPSELQPRDRNRMASKTQILSMVKNLLPELLVGSPTAQNGSPIVSNDGIVIGGNARSAALAEAYATGHADGYKSYITEHASEFGLNANNMPKNPVLVRVVDSDEGLASLAKQLNESTTAGYSTTEQALINEDLVMKVISKLNLDESANLNSEANRDFIQSFMRLLPENQRNEMMTKDGSLSAVGLAKTIQALTGAAYGSRDMLENLEQIDQDLKNISNAFISSAAKAADIRHSIESGMLNDLGVISTLLNGVDLLKTARGKHQSIEEHLNQLSLLGSDYAAEDIAIGKFFEANVRNATQLKNMIGIILDFAKSAGDPNQLSFDGIENISLSEVVRNAFAKYAEQYKKDIDYNALTSGYTSAEIGSRSDKRVDRTDALETEAQMTPVIEKNTKAKQEQAEATSNATEQLEAHAAAEEKVAEAANKAAEAKKKQADTGKNAGGRMLPPDDEDDIVETILEFTDRTKTMIDLISSAAGKSAATKFLEGITSETDLQGKVSGYFNEVFNSDDWKFKEGKGAWSIKGNTYVGNLVNEAQDAIHAVFKLDDGVLKLQEDLFKFDGANITDKFDLETAKASANASLRDLKAQLGGRAYDGLSELGNLFDNILDEPSFEKFTQRIKIAKQEVAALKKEYSSGSGTLNDFSRATETMRNAETVIETMHLQLNSLGDVDGVNKATEALNKMTEASENFKAATDETGQKNAYTQYNQAKADYEVNFEYAKASKKAAEAEAKQISIEDQKIQQYYQEILNTVNKINELDKEIEQAKGKNKTGAFSEFINKTQEEKAKLIGDVKSTLSEVAGMFGNGVLGQEVSTNGARFFSAEDTNNLNAFLQSAQVQTALAQGDVNKLSECLNQLSKAFSNSDKIGAQAAENINNSLQKVSALSQKIFKFDESGSFVGSNGLNENTKLYNDTLQAYQKLQFVQSVLSDKPKTDWTAEEAILVQKLSEEFLKLGTQIDSAKQKEDKFFAGKTKVTVAADGSTTLKAEEIEKLSLASDVAKEKLEGMAQAIAQNSENAESLVVLTKGFSMGADGIAKLDFSILNTNTGEIEDFTVALGTATGQMGVFETTVDKLAKSKQTALNQIQNSQNVLAGFGFGDVGLKDANAPAEVTKVLEKINELKGALDDDDENLITKCTTDLAYLTKGFEKAGNQARKMQEAIDNGSAQALDGINPKDNIYGQLTQSLQKHIAKYSDGTLEFGRFDKATNTLNATLTHTNGTVEHLKASMYGLNGECAVQQTGVGKLTSSWDRFKSSISQTGKQLMTALVGYNVFYKAMSEVRKGIGYVKEIDLALTELKKVTDETEESYRQFLNTAAGAAGEIGSTVSDFTEATANFARLGYTMEESADMAKTAIVYRNVADGLDTVEESTDSIISTMKAFGIESNDTMGIIDRFNEVGNNFAITSAGIGEALQRSASALYAGGNTIDESIALVTAANSVIQNPEQVGGLIAQQYSNILLENSYIG